MSDFLPYAIIAGIVIVFFVVCYVLFSGSDDKKEEKNEAHGSASMPAETRKQPSVPEKGGSKTAAVRKKAAEHTAPLPNLSAVTVREREENPEETAFVATKGEVVRKNGDIVYKAPQKKAHKPTPDELEITRVLSREEILAAMEQAEQEKTTPREAAAETAKQDGREDGESSLADMAAIVSADLAEKDGSRMEEEAPVCLTDETQVMDPDEVRRKITQKDMPKEEPASEQTMRMDAVHADAAAQGEAKTAQSPWGNAHSPAAKARPSIWNDKAGAAADSPVVKLCVSHFLNQFGMVTEDVKAQTEYITQAAFRRIECHTDAERKNVMTSLMAQEALQYVQKAYAAHPDEHTAALALQAFYDIVHGSPASTRHLIAMDALKVMPYLSAYHYKILAILLIFLYSRNSHNVDTKIFRQYIDRYVMPFMESFPTERPYYQQLEYMRCTALENKETRFAEILAESYPLLFRYRGITEEELRKALKGQRIPAECIVPSFNSPLVKLAMVDESMAVRFFRRAGITDRSVQDHIMRLAKKRPAPFAGEEALDIMEDISPVLADLSDIWDSTMLRVSTLSLLGLYIAQGYVREMIGEEFDLSRWFD